MTALWRRLRRILAIALVSLSILGVGAYVASSILEMPILASAVWQWIYWGFWSAVAVLFLASILRTARGRSSTPRHDAGSSAEQINDLYLGRTAGEPPSSSVSDYSARPSDDAPSAEEHRNYPTGHA